MQITHEEARRLIQFNTDRVLNSNEQSRLVTHLQDCLECRTYAAEIKAVETILLPVMKRTWSLQPSPLSIETLLLRGKRASKTQANMTLATRSAAVGAVFLAFIFSVWQFTMSSGGAATPLSISAPPIPTPSTRITNTTTTFKHCDEILYIVRENDTLESIAYRFSVSPEELMATNHMSIETVSTSMELIIPICSFTPTGTMNPSTVTPLNELTTFTPDG